MSDGSVPPNDTGMISDDMRAEMTVLTGSQTEETEARFTFVIAAD